jgi:hypothetical protein
MPDVHLANVPARLDALLGRGVIRSIEIAAEA